MTFAAPSSQHVFAQLDNEPEPWNSTHLEVQGSNPVTSDAYIAKTISRVTARQPGHQRLGQLLQHPAASPGTGHENARYGLCISVIR
jgi:hypothetical protein